MLKFEDLKNITILGAGTLGLRVGLQSAVSGYNVVIFDIKEEALEKAKVIHQKILNHLVRHGRILADEIPQIVNRITWTTSAEEAAKDADLINESVIEEADIKNKVWEQFGKLCPEKTIFTTNTSYMLPSMFAAISGRPEQFCAYHFHDVFTANVVDIMPHPGTSQEVIDLLMELGTKLEQVPVFVKRENPGYIFNQMLMAVLGAAGALVTYDVASIHDVDRSWMGNFKMPIGPFGIMDEIGLDTAWHVVHVRKDERSVKFAELLKSYLDAGKLGMKSGEGFYTYPKPAYAQPDFLMG